MAESTLSLTFTDLQAETGSFLGYGYGNTAPYVDSAWTTGQQQKITSCVKTALANVYWPERLEGENSAYSWSFMHPTASLDLPVNTNTINLPDDYGGFDGVISVLASTTVSQPWRIEWRNEGSIRQMFSFTPSFVGPPIYAAEVPLKGTTQIAGQRKQLLIFPIADQPYTLQVPYFVLPDYLTGNNPYVLGGAQHAQLFKASCLAVAENLLDDTLGENGPKRQEFKRRLAASMDMDRQNKPQQIGLNADRSDERGRLGWQGDGWPFVVPGSASYNGVPLGS